MKNLEMQRQDRIKIMLGDWNVQSPTVHSLFENIIVCKRCKARNECSAPVTGVGDLKSKIMVLGRNPGKNEDREGIPFIGNGGQLLDQWLQKAGIDRNSIYITNMVKCYTLMDRQPDPEEIIACTGWFQEELLLVKPKLILAFGRQAANYICGPDNSRLKVHARCFSGLDFNVIACVHPGAPLRNPSMTTDFNNDAYFVRAQIANNPSLVA